MAKQFTSDLLPPRAGRVEAKKESGRGPAPNGGGLQGGPMARAAPARWGEPD